MWKYEWKFFSRDPSILSKDESKERIHQPVLGSLKDGDCLLSAVRGRGPEVAREKKCISRYWETVYFPRALSGSARPEHHFCRRLMIWCAPIHRILNEFNSCTYTSSSSANALDQFRYYIFLYFFYSVPPPLVLWVMAVCIATHGLTAGHLAWPGGIFYSFMDGLNPRHEREGWSNWRMDRFVLVVEDEMLFLLFTFPRQIFPSLNHKQKQTGNWLQLLARRWRKDT